MTQPQILQYKAPIHGQDHDQQTKSWELVLSIVEGLENGSYTLGQIKAEAQLRLSKLGIDPHKLKQIGLPKRPK